MTKAQHTPGPWECGDRSQGDSPLMIYCNDATGSRVADCTTDLTFLPYIQKEANAQLIAASPDLLEALQYWIFFIESESGSSTKNDEWIAKAFAAIAKATGQAA